MIEIYTFVTDITYSFLKVQLRFGGKDPKMSNISNLNDIMRCYKLIGYCIVYDDIEWDFYLCCLELERKKTNCMHIIYIIYI